MTDTRVDVYVNPGAVSQATDAIAAVDAVDAVHVVPGADPIPNVAFKP